MSGALAIILARAGSKGVPGKNIAPVAGRPCIAWTIDHARASSSVARVVVSTDGPEIARVARDLGAEVVDRAPEHAHDAATVDAAARDALARLDAQDRAAPSAADRAGASAPTQVIVLLYANVPVRPAGLVDRAVRCLVSTGADSVQSYQPVGKHHPWWTARLDPHADPSTPDGLTVRPWEGDVLNHNVFRRQDLPPAFIPDGGVIACTRAALTLSILGVAPGPHAFFGRDRRGVINPEGSVVDIDAPIDLIVADAILRSR